MDILTLFSLAGIIIFIGFIGEWIFQKTNIPDVIWLMLLGFFVNQVFNVSESEIIHTLAPLFTTFALLFILFEGAINIDLKKLLKGVVGGGSLAFIYFLTCLIIVPVAMMMVGWGFWEGLLLAAMIGGISSDVIIPLAKKIKVKENTSLMLTLESAISDVLSIVVAITVINIIVLRQFSVVFVAQQIVYSFGLAIIAGVLLGIMWIKLQQRMGTKSYIIIIAALLLLYSFVEYMQASGAIACLAFGIIAGNSRKIFSFLEKGHDSTMTSSQKFFFAEISFFIKTFFFVYLGLIIDLRYAGLIILGFLLTLLLYLSRPIAVRLASGKAELKDRTLMEVLVPKGLAAAVLAQLPAQYGIAHSAMFPNIVLSVIMFSILLSTVGVFLTERKNFRGLGRYLDLRTYCRNIKNLYKVVFKV
jgi:potassium/hydrogen antiporter